MILLAFGLPKMGKTQLLINYAAAHAHEHLFGVCCRAGDWLPEAGRYPRRLVPWTKDARAYFAVLSRVAPELAADFTRGKAYFYDAPPPGQPLILPPQGIVRFGYPWEGLEVARLVRDVGDMADVDDEADEIAIRNGLLDPTTGKPVSWQHNPVRLFCHRGRHLPNRAGRVSEVHFLGAARTAQSLAPDLTRMADQVFIFRVQGSATLERLVEDGFLQESEVERVKALPPFHFKLYQSTGASSWGKLPPLAGGTSRQAGQALQESQRWG